MIRPLTTRQQEMLDAIQAHLAQYGWPPTIRGRTSGVLLWASAPPNGVRAHLVALARKGSIQRDPRVARGIRLFPRQ